MGERKRFERQGNGRGREGKREIIKREKEEKEKKRKKGGRIERKTEK